MARNSPSDDSGLAATPAASVEGRLSDTLDQLYETYEPSVERWVRRLAGPGAEVEDLVHDVFLVALRRRHEFRGDAKISTWLFRITELIVRKRRFRRHLRGFLNLVFRYSTAALAKNSSAASSARCCTRPWIACPRSTARRSSCSTSTAVRRQKWAACSVSSPTLYG